MTISELRPATRLPAAAPSLHETTGPGSTSHRWRPTRAGIVNLWRFYDEVFDFHDGRLLLRGPNGTGKSKALELLLPYLFDANLRPNRLSTFGGNERTMHWNLMGDGYPGSNRVGFVWLEFNLDREDTDWFTCGARLQASAHTTTVSATYFVTSQRIGEPGGLDLLGDIGTPLTRQALAAALGDHGEVFESSGDYRRAVRQRLFAGFSPEKYDALIAALLQLRTPKLSEHLDPGVLSTLLSKALPPLDHGDIAEIAEGFERLDKQRELLAALDDELAVATGLAARQRSYARRVLRSSAAKLISATSTMDRITRLLRESEVTLAETQQQVSTCEEQQVALDTENAGIEASIDGITASDDYREGRRIDELRTQLGQLRARHADAADRQRHLSRRAERDHAQADDFAGAAGTAVAQATRAGTEATTAAGRVGLSAACTEMMQTSDLTRARRLLRAAVEGRLGQIAEVRAALAQHSRGIARRDDAEATREAARENHAAAARSAEAATQARDQQEAQLAEALVGWVTQLEALGPVGDLGDRLAEHAGDEVHVAQLVAGFAEAVRLDWTAQEAALISRRGERDAIRAELADELAGLEADGERPPPVPYTRTADRGTRAGAPLYQLVSFAPDVSAEDQAGIEAALEASGLLDAWVLPDGQLQPQVDSDDPVFDTFASPGRYISPTGTSLATVLVAEGHAPVAAAVIEQLLAGVAYGPQAPDHVAAVGADGSWRLAATRGRYAKPEAAYVGAAARAQARRRRIAELTPLIVELDLEIAGLQQHIDDLDRQRDDLSRRLAARPPHTALRAAEDALAQAGAELVACADGVHRADAHLQVCEQQVANRLRELTRLAADQALPTQETALDRLSGQLSRCAVVGEDWLVERGKADQAAVRAGDARDRADTSAADLAHATEAAAGLAAEVHAVESHLTAVESSVGVAYQELVERVQVLRRRRTEIVGLRKSLQREQGELRQTAGRLESALITGSAQRDQATAERDQAADRFRTLTAGSLAEDASLGVEVGDTETIRSVLETARRVADVLSDIDYGTAQIAAAEGRLSATMHQAEQQLASRADLAFEFDEDVRLLTATIDGSRVGMARLAALLTEERDHARSQLSDVERELFDRTLTGEARRHLADRIRQASELVAGMNQRLRRVRTASNVQVSLVWQVDPALPAGTREARDLLLTDPARISETERDALHQFFRERVDEARAVDTSVGWEQQLLQVLDYTAWHRFVVRVDRGDGQGWQPVTKRMHGTMSGGEKAIVLHLPLFAAAAAHYQSAPAAPRLVLLDEVFVGIDTTGNRGQLLELLVAFDLDLVLTSDHEWCTYAELPGIAIHQLITGSDDAAVTTARFVWNGERKYSAEEHQPSDGLF